MVDTSLSVVELFIVLKYNKNKSKVGEEIL